MTRQTILHDKHVALGAKMVDFAGWHMPVQYSSIIEEHKAVRDGAGLFDVSHMGEIFVDGAGAKDFLNTLVPQDVAKLTDGKAVYCQLTNERGGILDDLIIYKLEENNYLIICNASRYESDFAWMVAAAAGFDVKLENRSDEFALLAVQGPAAVQIIEKLGVSTDQQSFSIKPATIDGVPVWASRTGYTGEDGWELMVENKYAPELWDKILTLGAKPIGLGARDTLRLEAALHLYGNDLDEYTTPVEAGLSWSVAKDKAADYNGKTVIMNQLANGTDKKLIGIKMLSKQIARHDYEVFFNGEKVGKVTSGGVSPMTGSNIALCYVKNLKEICPGTVVQVMIREKLHDAQVVKRPFIEKRSGGK